MEYQWLFRFVGLIAAAVQVTAFAATPWLPAPGGGDVSLSYVFQTADQFYQGRNRVDLPADLDQHTVDFALEYGLTDWLSVDARLGYSKTDFIVDPVLSPSASSLDGLTDTNIGVKLRLLDEVEGLWPTLTLRLAGIIEGDYETGAINAIGDGASGGEFSLLAGRFFENGFALSGEVGYRIRGSNVPADVFFNLGGSYFFNEKWSSSLTYHFNDSLGGLDIGDPGFSPARFPEVAQDYQILDVGLNYNITESTRVSFNYGTVIDGRNTADQDIFGLTLGFSF